MFYSLFVEFKNHWLLGCDAYFIIALRFLCDVCMRGEGVEGHTSENVCH